MSTIPPVALEPTIEGGRGLDRDEDLVYPTMCPECGVPECAPNIGVYECGGTYETAIRGLLDPALTTEAQVDDVLRDCGLDPAEVRAAGAAFVDALSAKVKP